MKICDVIRQELPSVQSELKKIFKQFPNDSEVVVKQVSTGEYVVKEGEPCLYVYLVLEGKVAVQYYSGHNAFVARRFGRMAVIGDVAVMGSLKNYSTNVRAVTRCRLLEIRNCDYWYMLRNDEEFMKAQLKQAIDILVGELKDKRALEEEPVEIRLLNYFVYYCRKEKTTISKYFVVKKTRPEIAEEVGGVSVRTVNRKLVHFIEQKLVSVNHGKIYISLEQLRRMEELIAQ